MRDGHTDTLAEFDKSRLSLIYMVELIFDPRPDGSDGTFRMWTGWGELRIGEDQTAFTDGTNFSDGTAWTDSIAPIWYGAGELGAIGRIEETTEGRAVGLEMTLGLTNRAEEGIPKKVIDYALDEDYQGRPGLVYLAALNETTGQIIGDPLLVFEGFMDQMSVLEGSTNAIKLTLENEAYMNEIAANRRYTDEDQQSRYAGDRFNQYAGSLAVLQQIPWGRASV